MLNPYLMPGVIYFKKNSQYFQIIGKVKFIEMKIITFK